MTEKKIPTVEQLNDFRQLLKTASCDADYTKLNAFIEEYDLYTKVYEENGKMGVKDAAGQVLVPAVFDEVGYTFMDHFKPYAVPVVKDGVKGYVDSKGQFTTDEDERYFGAFCD